MYSFKSRVRYSEVGEDKKLSLNSIINYFQDCSTFQSELLNNGVERLEELHRVWVLSSWQIVIERYPKLCEEIEIGTWPYYFKNFAGYRNFIMRDKEGKLIAYANSLWSFLDTDTGLPIRVPADIEQAYVLEVSSPGIDRPLKWRHEEALCGAEASSGYESPREQRPVYSDGPGIRTGGFPYSPDEGRV